MELRRKGDHDRLVGMVLRLNWATSEGRDAPDRVCWYRHINGDRVMGFVDMCDTIFSCTIYCLKGVMVVSSDSSKRGRSA